jgi:hypothetical protein
MKYTVENFTGASVLEMTSCVYQEMPFVSVVSQAGGLRMQHDMTPEKARTMARYLIASAMNAEVKAHEALTNAAWHQSNDRAALALQVSTQNKV